MPALIDYACQGSLTIDSLSLNTPAWSVVDLTPLWAAFDTRGQNRLIPGASGVVAYRKRITERDHSLAIVIIGDVDENGDAHTDPVAGLEDNLDTLMAVLAPDAGATKSAVLTLPSGTTRTAEVQIESFEVIRTEIDVVSSQFAAMEGIITMTIPAGVFA
jgi:hypothetical protein